MERKKLPGRLSRAAAAVCGLVLTPLLVLTILCLAGNQVLLSEALHKRIALNSEVLQEERKALTEDVQELAREYGFAPERVMNLVTDDILKEWNLEGVRWLTGSARTGTLQEASEDFEIPGLAETLREDSGFLAGKDEEARESGIREVAARLSSLVGTRVCFLRNALVKAAERVASRVVHLPNLVALMQNLPLFTALLCLLLAGLTVLLLARRPLLSLRYIGAAMIAGGLLLLCTVALIPMLGLGQLMTEISGMLGKAYRMLAFYLTGGLGLSALSLGVLGALGMHLSRRAGKG